MNGGVSINSVDNVIGREKLKEYIDKLYKESDKNVLLVKGVSGIGKTFAISNIINNYDEYKTIICKQNNQYITEFTIIKNLIDKLMEYVLTLPTRDFNPLIYYIRANLSEELKYVINFGDNISKVFKDIKIKRITDYIHQKYKIRKAINNFIKILCNALGKTCIFLDDIQWVDNNSLDIIKTLIRDKSINAIFIVAYRDSFAKFSKEEKMFRVIELHSFIEKEVREIIVRTISSNVINIDYLVRYVCSITLGNPFYISKIIDEFKSKKIVEINENGKYIVHIDKLMKSNISENINEVMLSRISELSKEERVFLEYLSCFEGDVNKKYIQKLFNKHCDTIVDNLITKSFIFVTKDRYSFTHDIIFEYIYKKIDIEKKEQIFYSMAKNLTEFYQVDKNLWPLLVTSIINSTNIQWDINLTRKWFNVLSQVLKRNVDFKNTRSILMICKELMDKYTTLYNDEIIFKLAKYDYLLGYVDEAIILFDCLKTRSNNKEHMLKIEDEKMKMHAYLGNHEKAMETGIKMLEILGFEYNISDRANLINKLNNINNLDSFNLCVCSNKDVNCIDEQYILYRMVPSAKIVCHLHFEYCMLLIATLAFQKKEKGYRIYTITSCSYVMFILLDKYEVGKQLSDIVIRNLDFNSDEEIVQETISFYLTFVHHWSNDIYDTIYYLEKNNLNCFDKGVITHFEYSLASLLFAYCIVGKNIRQSSLLIKRRLKILEASFIEGKSFSNTFVESIFENYIEELKSNKEIEIPSLKIKIEEVVKTWFSVLASYINNHIKEVYKVIILLEDYFVEIRGHIVYVDMIFITTLIRMEYYKYLDKDKQIVEKDIIDKNIIFLSNSILHYSENHLAKYYFIKGMYDYVFRDKDLSIGYINKGILLSKKRCNYLLTVIGYRLADICNNMPELKNIYLMEKSKAMDRYILNKTDNEEIISNLNTKDFYAVSVLHNIKKMSKHESFKYFLDNIVEKSLCNYACVLINDNNTYRLAYERKENNNTVCYVPNIKIDSKVYINKQQILMTKRIMDIVVKKNNSDNKKYIITVPMQVYGEEIGMVYLETIVDNKDEIIDVVNFILPYLVYKFENVKYISDENNLIYNKNGLTVREIEILKYLSKGYTNKEISDIECISTGTVKSHLNNIYKKLNVKNRRNAVIVAKEWLII